jgi:hypothetical protein
MSEIKKVRYTHDAIIDMIIATPEITQRELSRQFGFTEAWMSIIINSDAFQERLAERKGVLVDPKITASIEARVDALAKRALDRLMDRVEAKNGIGMRDADLIAAAKLGVGNRNIAPPPPPPQHNLYVVQIPMPATSAQEWMATRSKIPTSQDVSPNADGIYSVGGQ